jgi:DNA mismatch repair protein MutS2
MMAEASRDVEDLLAKIREKASTSGGHRLESEARGALHTLKKKYAASQAAAAEIDSELSSFQAESIEIGELYEAKTLGISGTARAVSDDGKNVVLESGSFRITVPALSLRRVQKDRHTDLRKRRLHSVRIRGATDNTADIRADVMSRASAELILLGKRVDEAWVLLDQFLDDAVLAGLTNVRIVHGKGTGALRQATQEALSRDRRVDTFRLGGEGEGGDGVTIVKLRHDKLS